MKISKIILGFIISLVLIFLFEYFLLENRADSSLLSAFLYTTISYSFIVVSKFLERKEA